MNHKKKPEVSGKHLIKELNLGIPIYSDDRSDHDLFLYEPKDLFAQYTQYNEFPDKLGLKSRPENEA